MKKVLALLVLIALLACCFAGCKKTEEPKDDPDEKKEDQKDDEKKDDEKKEQTGAYTIAPEEGTLPEGAKAAFDEAVADLDGVAYKPLACIGTQAVSGTNYLILTSATATTPDAKPELKVLKIYKGNNGELAKYESSSDFKYTDYLKGTVDTTVPEVKMGAPVVPAEGGMNTMPEKLASATSAAFGNFKDLKLVALTCLGTQIVSGVNYLLVCSGTPETEGAATGLFMVEIYNNTNDEASVTSVCPIDITVF